MAGIYIHIPFCKQACHYCNFHFTTSLRYKNEMIGSLLKEIQLRQTYLAGDKVDTIYFGGGTPSLLDTEDIQRLLGEIRSEFEVSPEAEITLETNPDDITGSKLLSWAEAGINRLSIGIQSFFEEDLRWMNRVHTASQALESLQLATSHFKNITIDLIYGTPGLSNEKWKQNVDTFLSLNIPHLSAYALTVEPKTPLQKLIDQRKKANVDPGSQSEQFMLLMQWMEAAGFEHYEISNFAKPGWRSQHNSSYWRGSKYLGIGPSAHSFDMISRQWNISNNTIYIKSINEAVIPLEKEDLTQTQRLNERIMTSLRTMEGLDIGSLDASVRNRLLAASKKFIDNGLMVRIEDHLILTKEGKLLADGIAADLFEI